jgi:tight adherence protein C
MNSTIALLAFTAAVGAFLVVQSLGRPRLRVRLTERDERPFAQRVVEAFFAPAAVRVMTTFGRTSAEDTRATLERRLARAGYPSPFANAQSVLGYRLFLAVFSTACGALFAAITGMGAMALPMALALGAIGWLMPDRIIASAQAQRVEQLTLDAASALDRLAIFVAAGNALPAAVTSLAERPGGAWVAEFRRIAAHYATHGDFAAALEDAIERNGGLPEITRVCERLRAAYVMGGRGISQSLRRMAQDARTRVRNVITERGYRNAVLMILPAFLALVAAGIVLIAPGAAQMLLFLE